MTPAQFNGMVVGSMIGGAISFLIGYALGWRAAMKDMKGRPRNG